VPATRAITRTASQIADEALGSGLDLKNWGQEGAAYFNRAVLAAASRVRQTLTGDEAVRLQAHVDEKCAEYQAVTAELRRRPGGPSLVTARIIVAMYWQMLTQGADEG